MKKTLSALVLSVGLLSSSCLGPDHLYNSVKNWNAGLSEQDWVNELVYIGLHIIPVYGVCLVGDILVCNTVGYWSGNNLVKDPGPFPGFQKGD
jgi:hypothetical protein